MDKIQRTVKPPVYYISEALISTSFGIFLGLTCQHFIKDSNEIALACAGIGGYLGKKSLNILSRLILGRLANVAGISIESPNKGKDDNEEDSNGEKKNDPTDQE